MRTGDSVPAMMRASVLIERGRLESQKREVPVPLPDEVLIRVASVGVCGSDVHYYRHGRIGEFVVEAPLILGHEASGRVVAVGDRVDPARIGDRVAVEPQRPCRRCRLCKTGRLNLCPSMRFYATPPVDGAFCEYVTIGADFAHAVPDSVSDDAAALLEPLSVGVWAVRKARLGSGSTVFVAGAGPIGIMTVVAARAAGATGVVVSDPLPSRRARVAQFGATEVIDPAAGDLPVTVDAFIDCSGAAVALRSGLGAVAPGGWVVLVGAAAGQMRLPLSVIQARELNVTGVFRYVDTWPAAAAIAASGGVSLDALVTARYGLSQVREALESGQQPGGVKSIVEPWR